MEGCHGMSLANEDWADKQYRGRQLVYHDAAVADHASAAKVETLTDFVAAWAEVTTAYQPHTKQHTDKSVAQWPALALAWLDKIGG